MKYNVVVLLSGGLDSTTVLAKAISTWTRRAAEHVADYDPRILAISVVYGQKHDREIAAAQNVAKHYKCDHQILRLPADVFRGAGSTLVDDNTEIPDTTYAAIAERGGVDGSGMSPTYVPFRNANLISLATAVAVTRGASELWVGMHSDDASDNAYADCGPEFLGSMASAVYIGTYQKVRLVIPFMWTQKAQIVQWGIAAQVPYGLTWSCYRGGEKHCGRCSTCHARREAFIAAWAKDPVEYEDEGQRDSRQANAATSSDVARTGVPGLANSGAVQGQQDVRAQAPGDGHSS